MNADPDAGRREAVLDARVRRGLQAVAAPDQSTTRDALARVQQAHRPRSRGSWPAVLAVAATVAVLLLVTPWIRSQLSRDDLEPAPDQGQELSGTWSRSLEARREPTWSGTWTIAFDEGGVLRLGPPAGARSVSDGAAYAVAGRQVRVDAFVNSTCYELAPGSYGWSLVPDGLRLTPLSDDCEERVELLSGTWSVVP